MAKTVLWRPFFPDNAGNIWLIARGTGIAYRCVERREELAGAVAGMKACKGAYLLEVRVESEENVFPMVPAGAPVSAIRLE